MSVQFRVCLAVLACCLACGLVSAEGEATTGWTDTAEFAFVATGGNSSSSSLGFKNVAAKKWDKSLLTLKAAGIRAESESDSGFAMALPGGGFRVVEPDSELTAESYNASARYDRTIHEKLFWFAGLGWDRNRFSGIDNRWIAEGGVGNVWRSDDDLKFSTTYGITWTDQEDVFPTPGLEDTFLGARLAWDYLNALTKNTTYTNTLVVDENLDETSDWRADMSNGLSVSMTEKTAIKLGLRLLYDNEPAVESLALFDEFGIDTGTTVLVELDELDTIFTASVVINFK